MDVRTDLEPITRRIDLPGVKGARWIIRPRGTADPNVPGPTDTILTAAVRLDAGGWAALDKKVGGPHPGVALPIPPGVTAALLGTDAAGEPRAAGGPRYDISSLVSSLEAGEVAVRVGDDLVFQLTSR